jgi:hypothetical protein
MNLPAARTNELYAGLPDQWKQLQAARMANLQSFGTPAGLTPWTFDG